MSRTTMRAFLSGTGGAVAPTVALALVGLLAIGGVAFDYSRLVGMHSELQNAADQAALAAATQLDGKDGARAAATAAASNLVANSTLISDDSDGTGVAIATVVFYQNKSKTPATTDANARYAEVTVDGREVFYALTPIVGALSSGDIDATAMAGLGSAICKVPPVMICNPNENSDADFTVSNYIGKGLKLVSVGAGNGAWSAGNFGYLDTDGGSNGATGLREALGWTNVPGNCQPGSGVDTKPGASVAVTDALNTRFDIDNSNPTCPNGGNCPPSANSVKDLIKRDGTSGNNACRIHGQGWQESTNTYLPGSTTPLTTAQMPLTMGHPRDICHAYNGTCNGVSGNKVGDGIWDIDAYFYVNYNHATHAQWTAALATGTNAVTASGGSPPYGITRYQVYRWEMSNAGTSLNGQTVLGARTVSGSGANALKSRGAPYCTTPGITPGGTNPDRRRLSMAVVNCSTGDNGGPVNGNSTGVTVQKWVDVFLVEPSYARNGGRTGAGDVYVEVIEESESGGDGTAGQVVRRDVPYLVE